MKKAQQFFKTLTVVSPSSYWGIRINTDTRWTNVLVLTTPLSLAAQLFQSVFLPSTCQAQTHLASNEVPSQNFTIHSPSPFVLCATYALSLPSHSCICGPAPPSISTIHCTSPPSDHTIRGTSLPSVSIMGHRTAQATVCVKSLK